MKYSQQAIKFWSKAKFVSKIKTEEEWLKQDAYVPGLVSSGPGTFADDLAQAEQKPY
jgi:hypothetical protein